MMPLRDIRESKNEQKETQINYGKLLEIWKLYLILTQIK